jgi:hypothetical protein
MAKQPGNGIAVVPDREPWERQHGESAKAFAAFAHYRDTPAVERSLRNTARFLSETIPDRTGKPESIRTELGKWSVKWNWVARVEAYEIAEDRRRRLERAAHQRTMEERHAAAANTGLIAYLLRTQGGKDRNGRDVEALTPDQIGDWTEAMRVLESSVRIGRLTQGLPTDLMRSMDTWSTQDVMRLTRAVIDCMLPYIADEHQHEAVTRVQDVFLGWGRR